MRLEIKTQSEIPEKQAKEKKKPKPFNMEQNTSHSIAHQLRQQKLHEDQAAEATTKIENIQSSSLKEVHKIVESSIAILKTSDKTQVMTRYSSNTDPRLRDVVIEVTKYASQPLSLKVVLKTASEGLQLLTSHRASLEKHLAASNKDITMRVLPVESLSHAESASITMPDTNHSTNTKTANANHNSKYHINTPQNT